MSEKRWTIGRPINGVSLNNLEYLCDNAGRQLMYDSEESARADLRRYGYSDKRIEDEGIVICCFNEGDYMASLEKRNEELEAKVAELESKHWNECRQIAHYADELRKAKELLKAAVEDINNSVNDVHCKYCSKWHTDQCQGTSHLDCYIENKFKWRYADEALALIGEDTNVPASAEGTNVGHKSGGWISCKDNMPDTLERGLSKMYSDCCLVCDAFGWVGMAYYITDGQKSWWEFADAQNKNKIDWTEVTHWQPLPEPPKDGDT